jgi:hypothetical protein
MRLSVITALQSRGISFPVTIAGLVLLSVFAAGLISSMVSVVVAVRSPLLSALHSE